MHAEVSVTFLSGKREMPPASGYRGQFYCSGEDWSADWHFDGEVSFDNQIKAKITFVEKDKVNRISRGQVFVVREGNNVVGSGVVLRVAKYLPDEKLLVEIGKLIKLFPKCDNYRVTLLADVDKEIPSDINYTKVHLAGKEKVTICANRKNSIEFTPEEAMQIVSEAEYLQMHKEL